MDLRLKDMFIGKYNKSVILTYIGVALRVLGMAFAFDREISYALSCLVVAGICDLFDGKIARMCKRNEAEKSFGVEIDSLADIFNFIAFPIIIFIGLGLKSWMDICIYIFYALAGIIRLAYFNMHALENNKDVPVNFYQGLPVTYAALILPVAFLFSYFLQDAYFLILYRIIMFFIGVLFILNIRINKPKGKEYLFFSLLAIVVLYVLLKGF